jgi:hypothetical protein
LDKDIADHLFIIDNQYSIFQWWPPLRFPHRDGRLPTLPGPDGDKENQPDGVVPQVVLGWRSLPGTGKSYLQNLGKRLFGPNPILSPETEGLPDVLLFYKKLMNSQPYLNRKMRVESSNFKHEA